MTDPPATPDQPFSLDQLLTGRMAAMVTTRCGRCDAAFDGDAEAGREWFRAHQDSCPARTSAPTSP